MTKKPFRETTAGKFEYSVLVNSSDLLNNFRYNLSVLIWFALMISIVFVIFYDSLIILCFFFPENLELSLFFSRPMSPSLLLLLQSFGHCTSPGLLMWLSFHVTFSHIDSNVGSWSDDFVITSSNRRHGSIDLETVERWLSITE